MPNDVSSTGGSVPTPSVSLSASFPWGVLLVTDDNSNEAIPAWDSDDTQVTSSSSALVVRVVHDQEGSASVFVWRNEGKSDGLLVFDGTLDVPSGRLRASDALGRKAVWLDVAKGLHPVRVYTDQPTEATRVDIVVLE